MTMDKMEPIQIPITDVLDLHTFLPREVPDLLNDYFEACVAKGIFSVRIIHGKGRGVLKARVVKHLKRHPLVRSIQAAPADAGGWGATLVELNPKPG
jgi:DNA-nicking Smr family endonuclease